MVSDGDTDSNLGAAGSTLDVKTKGENKEDSSESGEEQDVDDDEGSSVSRDSSQHRGAKRKKRHPKRLNARQRKKQQVFYLLSLILFHSLLVVHVQHFHAQYTVQKYFFAFHRDPEEREQIEALTENSEHIYLSLIHI